MNCVQSNSSTEIIRLGDVRNRLVFCSRFDDYSIIIFTLGIHAIFFLFNFVAGDTI